MQPAIENGRRCVVTPELHLTKAANFAATAARLDPTEDYEAIMWAGMHSCTHWTNAIFHAKGLTSVEFDFEHSWYIDRCPDPDRVLAGLDDQLGGLLDALAVFEGLRAAYVRGPGPFGPGVLVRSQEALEQVRTVAEEVFGPL
jgi:hypothetical protein